MIFEINNYLTLKLEKEKTNIYIKGKLFQQCKNLMININTNKINSYNKFKSINDVIEQLPEIPKISIPPEVEFWGHCSNIQSWVENDYDTHLLDMMLAFPLLKALAEAGEKGAETHLSEEVLKRFNEGNENVKEYLIYENYLRYLKDYNKFYYLLDEENAIPLIDIILKYKREFIVEKFIPLYPRREECYIVIQKKKIVQMGLWLDEYCMMIPKEVGKFSSLKRLKVFTKNLSFNTENLEYKNIENLSIYIKEGFNTEININNIDLFPNLKSLGIYSDYNTIRKPKVILENYFQKLKTIESFYLEFLKIMILPENISELTSLKWLIIYYSDLNHLPKQIFRINSLEVVNLEGTNLETIPDSIKYNTSIKYFACEPYLMTPEMLKWIKNQNLEKFDNKTYKRSGFFNFPLM